MVNMEIFQGKDLELQKSKYKQFKDHELEELLSKLYNNHLKCEFIIHWIQDVPHKCKQVGKNGEIVWMDLGMHKTCALVVHINHDVTGPVKKTSIGDLPLHLQKTYKFWNIDYIRIQRIINGIITPYNPGDEFPHE